MCWKHTQIPNTICIFTGGTRVGKTLNTAKFIIECEDIPEDFSLPKFISEWAAYFDGRYPLTKLDLRQVLK